MIPTLETKSPGRDTLKGDKNFAHSYVHLSSNCTKHSRAAEETDRPSPMATVVASLPVLLWLLFSAVKMNLTAIAEPDSFLAKFPLGVHSSISPKGWSHSLV